MEKMWTMNDEGRKKEIGKLIRFYRIESYNRTKCKAFLQKNFIIENDTYISSRKTLINIENGIPSRCNEYYYKYAEKIDKNIVFSRKLEKIFDKIIDLIFNNLNGDKNEEELIKQYKILDKYMNYENFLYYEEMKKIIDLLYYKITKNRIIGVNDYIYLSKLKAVFENKILQLILFLISEFELYFSIKSTLASFFENKDEIDSSYIQYVTLINYYMSIYDLKRVKNLLIEFDSKNIGLNTVKRKEYIRMVKLFLNINSQSIKIKNLDIMKENSKNSFENVCSLHYYSIYLILKNELEDAIKILEDLLAIQRGIYSFPTTIYLLIALNLQKEKNITKIKKCIVYLKKISNTIFVMFNFIISYFDMVYLDNIDEKDSGEYIVSNVDCIINSREYYTTIFKHEILDLVSKSKNYKQFYEFNKAMNHIN